MYIQSSKWVRVYECVNQHSAAADFSNKSIIAKEKLFSRQKHAAMNWQIFAQICKEKCDFKDWCNESRVQKIKQRSVGSVHLISCYSSKNWLRLQIRWTNFGCVMQFWGISIRSFVCIDLSVALEWNGGRHIDQQRHEWRTSSSSKEPFVQEVPLCNQQF